MSMRQEEISKEIRTKLEMRTLSPDEFLTTQELMKLLKIRHKQTIYGLIEQGMPAIQVGKNYRFIKSEVVNFFKSQFRIDRERES